MGSLNDTSRAALSALISRRGLLISSAAIALAPRFAWGETPTKSPFILKSGTAKRVLHPDYDPVELWGYNDTTPGPVLRLKEGETFAIRYENSLPQPSLVHWHGLRIDNTMDGVPALTQSAVAEGESFDYELTPPDAGTYWYHSHNRSWEQVARGLYGALIVEETEPPKVDHDIIALLDDWRLLQDGTQAGDFENRHDMAMAGREGNFALVTFEGQNAPLQQGDCLRLRLINVATDRIFDVKISGLKGQIAAWDGMPLEALESYDVLTLGPGQRADILAQISDAKITFEMVFPDALYPLGELTAELSDKDQTDPEFSPLPPNRITSENLENPEPLTLTLQGGGMNERPDSLTDIWGISGQSGMGETPFARFERGAVAAIDIVNDTPWPHAIHLHGQHFREEDTGHWRDTTLLEADSQRQIICKFTNPGKWLIHCHMLGHEASGMMSWVEVS